MRNKGEVWGGRRSGKSEALWTVVKARLLAFPHERVCVVDAKGIFSVTFEPRVPQVRNEVREPRIEPE